MTVTDVARESVASALEVDDAVESHLHPISSFDLADHPMPTGREEIWRFTPLKRLLGALDDTVGEDGAVAVELGGPGEYFPGTLALDESPRGRALVPDDRAAAVASRNTAQALHVKVPADVELDEPLWVTVTTTAGLRSNSHIVVEAGTHARGTVVLDHRGSGVHAGNVEVVVADGADVTVVSIQDWDDDAVHVGTHEAVVGRDAHYRHVMVTFGGAVVRVNANVHYAGPGGEAELLGIYFADDAQHIEHRLFVDHNEPRTKSNVNYKGALQGQGAHTVWVGNVLIRKAAEGIETYEENRNLVLTDGCQADSVPNLEIETGEIEGAGHASAVGRFDDEQLFYLRARGIEESEARRLVVHGFFNDLIRKVGVPALQEKLMATVEDELAKNVLKGYPSAVST